MISICFATNNKHKLDEVRSILGPDFRILSLSDINFNEDLPETKDTFQGNAQQKAQYLFDKFNIPCFADDSGLEVTALNGAPGVYSARYAGTQRNDEDNIQLLLKNLDGIKDRGAQFRTVICFLTKDNNAHFFEGTIPGKISEDKRGVNGFGYDPLFIPAGHKRTFAEMNSEEKNAMSHRSVAVKKLAEYLKENLRSLY